MLCALAAVHHERTEQAGSAAASSWREKAQAAAAAAGEPGGPGGLATRAQAALAHDGGWRLLEEIFGPFDDDHPSGGQLGPDS